MNLNLSDFEEIISLQRQGRRLSNMQMQSLNDFVQRRLSMSNSTNIGSAQQQQQALSSTPPSSQYPMFYNRGNSMHFDPSPQQMMQHSSSVFGNSEQSYGRSFTPDMFRRDSLGFAHNILDEIGYHPEGSERRSSSMEKRNSLDLLGDAAVALSSNNDTGNTISLPSSSMYPSSNTANRHYIASNVGASQNSRRSSLDFLLGGDAMLGRRNSLTQFLIQEFANPSRRSSMLSTVGMNKPMDSFYLENLFDDPSIYSSGNYFPSAASNSASFNNYHSSSNSDLFGMQLMQQTQQESMGVMNNNNTNHKNNMDSAGDYFYLQNLQNSLRKQQSWNGTYHDFSTVPHLPANQTQGSNNTANKMMQDTAIWQKPKKKDARTKHAAAEPEIQVDPNDLPPFSLERMYSFKASMEKSIQTQNDIQMWDKKMGLKRSHSATMTQTTRSRKKLRRMLEKHLDILTKVKTETSTKLRKKQKRGQ